MTKEDKNLLIQDLSARLPYKTKIQLTEYSDLTGEKLPSKIKTLDYCMLGKAQAYCKGFRKDEIKPYLFPLSSMTEEQKEELENLGWYFDNFEIHNVNEYFGTYRYREYVAHSDCFELIDWLNKNHFDYRGLIEKGLAIDCTNLNIY